MYSPILSLSLLLQHKITIMTPHQDEGEDAFAGISFCLFRQLLLGSTNGSISQRCCKRSEGRSGGWNFFFFFYGFVVFL